MNRIIKYRVLLLIFSLMCSSLYAQDGVEKESQSYKVSGVVYDLSTNKPLSNVQINSHIARRAEVSDSEGGYEIEILSEEGELTFTRSGYFTKVINIDGEEVLDIYMQSVDRTIQSEVYSDVYGSNRTNEKIGTAKSINQKDISRGYDQIESAVAGRIAGLNVISKGGMPGEGSYVNYRGIRSLNASNTPMMVVDGMPLMPNQNMSTTIEGFSNSIYDIVNVSDINNVTLLTGVDAMPYGSMGSNGVLVVDMDNSTDQDTRVEFTSVEGVSFVSNKIDLLDRISYQDYISDIGSSQYPNPADLMREIPFLNDKMNSEVRQRYSHNTTWQDEIYAPAFISNNSLKVKGGDAVVKFMLNTGFQSSEGVVDGTQKNKFYTRANSDINFTSKLKAYASVAFNYTQLSLQEQGMSEETNPMIASFRQSPLMGVYSLSDTGGANGTKRQYTKVDPISDSSNPAAILDEVIGGSKMYDILVNANVDYKTLWGLNLNIAMGVYYNYIHDNIFIGGKSSGSISPLSGGLALNTVRDGSSEQKSYYGRFGANYSKQFNHSQKFDLSALFQINTLNQSVTTGSGINTVSDEYRSLKNVSNELRRSTGYSDVWNWLSGTISAKYSYKNQLFAEAVGIVDAASTYGAQSDRFFIYPGARLGWNVKNMRPLRNLKAISDIKVYADYGVVPNSRYASTNSISHYLATSYFNINGLKRAQTTNRAIAPEEVHSANVGANITLNRGVLEVGVNLFNETTRNMLVDKSLSDIYGFESMYENIGEISTKGIEVSFSSSIINRKDVQLMVGGTFASYDTKINSLGGDLENVIDLGDGVKLINRVGEAPLQFYGYESKGVFTTNEAAAAAGLKSTGGYQFSGGDIHFDDKVADGVINSKDNATLGSAMPDFYGSLFLRFNYKRLSLLVDTNFSCGNEVYNGVRRMNESASNYANQANSIARRWRVDGQVTDIPKSVFGDPADNNRFSSRWIEDASFFKIREIMVSYDINNKFWFLNGLKIFATAENMFTFTRYTGLDPEFAYSYDTQMLGMDVGKIPTPKSVKLGIVANF